MEIVSIVIRTDVLAVSAGSGPSEISLESLETSIIVSIDIFFGSFKRSPRRTRIVQVCLLLYNLQALEVDKKKSSW